MKHQTDAQLGKWTNSYGCFFMSLVYWLYWLITGIDRKYTEIIGIKDAAFDLGVITGDLNRDGDLDDAGAGEIQGDVRIVGKIVNGKDELLRLARVPLKYTGRVPIGDYRHEAGDYCIGEFWREWVEGGREKKFIHFVGIDGAKLRGRKTDREVVVYDPIQNSRTVRDGRLVAVRVCRADKPE